MAELFAVNNYIEVKKIRRRIISGFTVLGLGIGMIFGELAPGCLIGLGIGLLVSSLIKYKGDIKDYEELDKKSSSKFWKVLLGAFLILFGASILLNNYEIPWNYLSPIALTLIGLYFILTALRR